MERLTKRSADNLFYVEAGVSEMDADNRYCGEAINRLAKFEDLWAHLLTRHSVIPAELEALRRAGKEKTVTFKELLAEKMINDMLLTHLERQGLK